MSDYPPTIVCPDCGKTCELDDGTVAEILPVDAFYECPDPTCGFSTWAKNIV